MNIKSIEYTAGDKTFAGVIVSDSANPVAEATRPGILVFHGGAGPSEHERERARMLAELGYVAFVPDLFGERFESRAQGMAVIAGLVSDPSGRAELRARVNAALQRLRAEPGVDEARTGAIGFCFGGLAALELARSGADVAAVASIHGGLHASEPAATGAIACKVLVCTGAVDPFVPREQRAAFEDEMTNANADWQMIVHGGAQHGFTEKTPAARPGCAYHARADRESWRAMRDHFEEAFAEIAASMRAARDET